MKVVFCIWLSCLTTVFAQGTLQFNQSIILTDVQQTVPNDKVWKITAIYGKQNDVCQSVAPLYTNYYSKALISGVFVNNVEILSFRKFLSTTMYYQSSTCTASSNSGYDFSSLNFESDPNVLPVWLPAGTTVRTYGNNVFASVLEFNIIP